MLPRAHPTLARDYLDSLWERALNDFKAAAERSFTQAEGKETSR